jgi:arginyl-tRNA synthetase
MDNIKQLIFDVCNRTFNVEVEPELSRTNEKCGDYATNIALQLAKLVGKNPREVAETLAAKINSPDIQKVEIAGPGFLNITLTDAALVRLIESPVKRTLAGKVVVAEYSDPNPFKVLHAGHLYTSVIGDAIANLLESAGAEIHRVNFGGDVGLHVGKTMWAVLETLGGEFPEKLNTIAESERPNWITACYVKGTAAYEDSEDSKAQIIEINKKIYLVHSANDHESPLAQMYWTCRTWSYDYFNQFYDRIGTRFEKYYPESETAPLGLKTVNEQLKKGVYELSDGAVVFKGEPYGLHTRVFVNSGGLPTYEAKDVGLIIKKYEDYHFDKSVVITGNDIVEYMKVVLKSVEQFAPALVAATSHLTHGIVKLQGGKKMSSRLGNILRAEEVLDIANKANQQATGKQDFRVVLGAVKYAFLKQRTGGDIIYDPEESVSLEGNSGPYLQYAHARARSILSKKAFAGDKLMDFEPGERSLVRKISEYGEVMEKAVNELMPHLICTYLYELAQTFNRFYENNRVIDDPRENTRLQLVEAYAQTLRDGLTILGIPVPEKM